MVLSRRIKWATDPQAEHKKKLSAIREGSGEVLNPADTQLHCEDAIETRPVHDSEIESAKEGIGFLTDFSFIEELVKDSSGGADAESMKETVLQHIFKRNPPPESNIIQKNDSEGPSVLDSVFSIMPTEGTTTTSEDGIASENKQEDIQKKFQNEESELVLSTAESQEEFEPLSDFPLPPKQITLDFPLQIPASETVFDGSQTVLLKNSENQENTTNCTIYLNRNSQWDNSERIIDAVERVFLDAVFIGKADGEHEEVEGELEGERRWSRSDSGRIFGIYFPL